MMDLISIVVPVYNVEPYLDRCVTSIVNQSYKNLEIILVDDESPDLCPAICDAWADKDPRIKVIHQENRGTSSAKNAGIARASGKYIMFVDSDDWVNPLFAERLHHLLIAHGSEMSACCFLRQCTDTLSPQAESGAVELVTSLKYQYSLSEDYYAGYAWNKCFLLDIIKTNHLYFDENIHIGEDLLFVVEYLSYINRVAYSTEKLYYYYIHSNSMTTETKVTDRSLSVLQSREKVLELMTRFAPECIDIVKASYLSHLIKFKYAFYPVREEHQAQYNVICNKIKLYQDHVWRFKGVSLKSRIKLFIMIYCSFILGAIYRKRKGIKI